MSLEAWHIWHDAVGRHRVRVRVETPQEARTWLDRRVMEQRDDAAVHWNAFGLETDENGEWEEWYDAEGRDVFGEEA